MKKSREEMRIERADELCREVRHQLSNFSNRNEERMYHFLLRWMRVAKKSKFIKPKIKHQKNEMDRKSTKPILKSNIGE